MRKHGKQGLAFTMAAMMALSPLQSISLVHDVYGNNVKMGVANVTTKVNIVSGQDATTDVTTNATTKSITKAGTDESVEPAYLWDFETQTNLTLKGTATINEQNIQIGETTYSQTGNQALVLSGGAKGSGYVELPSDIYDGIDSTTGFTYSFWLKSDSNIGSYSRVISSANASSGDEFAFAPYASDKVWNVLFDTTNVVFAPMATEPEKGVWNLVTFTVNADEIVFYINGETVGTVASSLLGARLDTMNTLVNNALGKTCSGWSDADAKAVLDDVRLYKQALSAQQVADLANSYGFHAEVKQTAELGSDTQWTDGTELSETAVSITKGDVSAKIMTDDMTGRFFLTASKGEQVVMDCSLLGMKLAATTDSEAIDLSTDMELVADSIATTSGVDSYILTTGNKRNVNDAYEQITFTLKSKSSERQMTIQLRCYEDGVAYQYLLKGEAGQTVTLADEMSEVVLPADSIIWTGYDEAGNYEYEYQKKKMSQVKQESGKYSVPLLAQTGEMWTLTTEAAVFSDSTPFCASHLVTAVGNRSLQYTFGRGSTSTISVTYDEEGNVTTPWRTMICTDNLNDLMNSTVVTSLNPQADPQLFAEADEWIRTGTVAWSWWSEAGDDPIEYEQQKDFIDFAAENGWEYVCLDFGWCLWEDYQTKVKELIDYGKEKNVDIMLWYGVNNDNHAGFKDASGVAAYPKYSLRTTEQLEEQFAWCESVGVKGVKVDYYENDNTATMIQMNECAVIAAQHKLNVLFHGCTVPHGEQRTFPHVLSYEAVRGSEYYKWNVGPSVLNCLIYPFNRNITGGMDFTPVGMQIDQLPVTAGFQLSQVVAYESGFQNIASSVYKLEGFAGLSLINAIPNQWDETKLIEGYPGTYFTMARRTDEDWYIASMTASARQVKVALDFLGDGTYYACLYEDNADGSDIVVTQTEVTKEDTLTLNLLTNGGASVKISKEPIGTTTTYDAYTYYEAEDAVNTLSGTTKVGTNQFASGEKQVINVGQTAYNTVTFNNVTVDKAGVYEMRLYYACGVERRICYTINDAEAVRSCKLNAGVNTLAMEKFYVELKEGTNTITFGNIEAKAPNVDRIAISLDTVEAEVTKTDNTDDGIKPQDGTQYDYNVYAPSDATLTGGARVEGDGIGWLGGSASCKATFTVNAEQAGNYKLQIQYYTGETRNVYVQVNGGNSVFYSCPSTGSYLADSAECIYVDVTLKAGANTITLLNPSSWCPNIASIGISKNVISVGADSSNNGNNVSNNQSNSNNTNTNNTNSNASNKQNANSSNLKVEAKQVQVKAAGYQVSRMTLKKGSKATLKVTVFPSDVSQNVTYKLSKSGIVTISKKGVVKAKKTGKVTVTVVSADQKASTEIQIKVVNQKKTNKKLKLANTKITLNKKGATAQIMVKSMTKWTTDKITYKVIKGKKYVKVDKFGTVTAKVKASKKTKKAVIQVKCGKVTKKVKVTIKK